MEALIDSFGLGVLDLAGLNIIGVLGLAGPNFIGVLDRVGPWIGKTPVRTVVRVALVLTRAACPWCFINASAALFITSTRCAMVSAELMSDMLRGIEFIVWVMLLRLKNTVEKLSTLVHGYPIWFSNQPPPRISHDPQNNNMGFWSIPTGTRIIKFCPSAQEIPSTMAGRPIYGYFSCEPNHP
jgi:hypothetical protein